MNITKKYVQPRLGPVPTGNTAEHHQYQPDNRARWTLLGLAALSVVSLTLAVVMLLAGVVDLGNYLAHVKLAVGCFAGSVVFSWMRWMLLAALGK